MTDEQIKKFVVGEIAKADSANRFRLNPTNRHIHNNIDCPFVFLPYSMYGGIVPYDGNLTGILESSLPKGWRVNYDGGTPGFYEVVHNLGNANYVVTATATQSTNQVVSAVVETFQNSFFIGWFDTSNANQDTSWNFVLMAFTGNSATFPTYTTNHIPNI